MKAILLVFAFSFNSSGAGGAAMTTQRIDFRTLAGCEAAAAKFNGKQLRVFAATTSFVAVCVETA